MLRESMQISGKEVNVSGVTRGFDADVEIPNAHLLIEFAQAVVSGDTTRIAVARDGLRPVLGDQGLVDAAAIVGAFHGFVRIADAIGIPYTTAARGADVPELRAQAGVNEFYRVREAPLPGR